MKAVSLLLSTLTILAVCDAALAGECRTRSIGTPGEELKMSAAVFGGKVIEVTKPRPDEHLEG